MPARGRRPGTGSDVRTSRGTQYLSMAHGAEPGAQGRQKMLGQRRRHAIVVGPGSRRGLSLPHELPPYLNRAGVHAEVARLRVAAPFLDFERVDWFPIALRRSQRPQTRTELKKVIPPHSNAVSEVEALECLRRVRQLSTVQDHLIRFNKAAAECPAYRKKRRRTRLLKA